MKHETESGDEPIQKLKVGDKIYNERNNRWTGETEFLIGEVVRITKTQAVLSNGIKLINEVVKGWNKENCFAEYGNRWNKWFIQTNDFLERYNEWRVKRIIEKWFDAQKFTFEEKKIIYKTLKK